MCFYFYVCALQLFFSDAGNLVAILSQFSLPWRLQTPQTLRFFTSTMKETRPKKCNSVRWAVTDKGNISVKMNTRTERKKERGGLKTHMLVVENTHEKVVGTVHLVTNENFSWLSLLLLCVCKSCTLVASAGTARRNTDNAS